MKIPNLLKHPAQLLTSVVLGVLVILPLTSFAVTIDAGADIDASVSGSSTGGSVNGEMHADGDMESEDDAETEDNVSATGTAHSEGTMEIHGSDVSVAAVEIRGWDAQSKADFLANVKTHAEVASSQDLEVFAKGVLLKDSNVERVDVGEDGNVTVDYKGRGRLFGFIPLSFTQRVNVRANEEAKNRVSVRYPWFGFLMATNVSAADIKASIEQSLASDTQLSSMTVDAAANVRVSADIINAISAVLKAKAEASASVQ